MTSTDAVDRMFETLAAHGGCSRRISALERKNKILQLKLKIARLELAQRTTTNRWTPNPALVKAQKELDKMKLTKAEEKY